jgi:hypothetical protein
MEFNWAFKGLMRQTQIILHEVILTHIPPSGLLIGDGFTAGIVWIAQTL